MYYEEGKKKAREIFKQKRKIFHCDLGWAEAGTEAKAKQNVYVALSLPLHQLNHDFVRQPDHNNTKKSKQHFILCLFGCVRARTCVCIEFENAMTHVKLMP